jgi:26S proteasome regulatory subunit N11
VCVCFSGLQLQDASEHKKGNNTKIKKFLKLSKEYSKRLVEQEGKTRDEVTLMNVGKQDPKRHLEETVEDVMAENIDQNLGAMIAILLQRGKAIAAQKKAQEESKAMDLSA